MTIACLGWGSLIWQQQSLPVASQWRPDGPSLPVEFVRQSDNGRITLVLAAGNPPLPVLWCELNVASIDAARHALAEREVIKPHNAERLIGVWPGGGHAFADHVGDWAIKNSIDGVVWTALGPKFSGKNETPSREAVVAYLRGLSGHTRMRAEEYVRKAPASIRTGYRTAIEEVLGWTPIA